MLENAWFDRYMASKYRPQHGGWQWHPLIDQVPAGKSKTIPPLHGGLQLSKITKKNSHIPYNIRWKCFPPSFKHFWHILGNVHLHGLIQFHKYSQFHAWYLLSILLICGGSLHTLYFSSAPIDKNRKPTHIRRIGSKYQALNWPYFGNRIIRWECTFPKKMPEMYRWRRTTFPTAHVIRYVIIFLCNFSRHRGATVLLSICRPGPRFSAVAIASRRSTGDTQAKGTVL